MKNAKRVVLEIAKEYETLSGKSYGYFEEYKLEDADLAVVIMGSAAGTAKETADRLRKEGIKAGVLKLRMYRPFPGQEIAKALSHVKAVAIMDRAESFSNMGGPVFAEVKAAMYDLDTRPKMIDYIYGLGGRDVRVESIKSVFSALETIVETGETGDVYRYLDVRE